MSRDEEVPRDPLASEPLGKAERFIALAIGIGAGGGGAYAVFVSANQAGTAVLLVLSAVFLLIGVQGTALIRFGGDSYTVELARRKKVIAQKVIDVAKDDLGRAEGIIEGAGLAIPDLRDFPFVEETLYVRRLESAISGLGYETSSAGYVDPGPDITVKASDRDVQVIVEVKYLKQGGPLGDRTVRNIIHQYNRSLFPLLIVTNARTTGAAEQSLTYYTHADRQVLARSVQWRDNSDDAILREALSELFSSVQSK